MLNEISVFVFVLAHSRENHCANCLMSPNLEMLRTTILAAISNQTARRAWRELDVLALTAHGTKRKGEIRLVKLDGSWKMFRIEQWEEMSESSLSSHL